MKVYDGRQSERVTEAEPDRRKVGIAEYEVTTDGAELTTSGLGSCIGVALHDRRTETAGLVHVMLPSAEEMEDGNRAKFADTGVDALIEAMEESGASREHLEAKIAGGSDMLDFSEDGSTIGARNVETARRTLAQYEIPIVGEDVGGDHGRSLRLKPHTGNLVVKNANTESTVL